MKTTPNKEFDPLASWIKEAGLESPSSEFSSRLIQKISSLPKVEYKPVISPFGWKLILGYIGILFLAVSIFSPSEKSNDILWNKVPSIKMPQISLEFLSFNFPSLELSQNLVFGILTFIGMSIISIWFNYKNRIA
ncbi:hypothetical protein DFQ04_3597 [Algoriphagus boseongensis]|uniref:Uncharacterized protein n=1 Tax=Algoriphagus boseongensis TaxID=1442587 RepID=A0A4R6T2L4_9BACT|nr:hypothetical protein [Algoriphagus boseongensis]TDQ13562.1 hypothetical protein DFQ04_3597 [Algoriphagus boseongensis]